MIHNLIKIITKNNNNYKQKLRINRLLQMIIINKSKKI